MTIHRPDILMIDANSRITSRGIVRTTAVLVLAYVIGANIAGIGANSIFDCVLGMVVLASALAFLARMIERGRA